MNGVHIFLNAENLMIARSAAAAVMVMMIVLFVLINRKKA